MKLHRWLLICKKRMLWYRHRSHQFRVVTKAVPRWDMQADVWLTNTGGTVLWPSAETGKQICDRQLSTVVKASDCHLTWEHSVVTAIWHRVTDLWLSTDTVVRACDRQLTVVQNCERRLSQGYSPVNFSWFKHAVSWPRCAVMWMSLGYSQLPLLHSVIYSGGSTHSTPHYCLLGR